MYFWFSLSRKLNIKKLTKKRNAIYHIVIKDFGHLRGLAKCRKHSIQRKQGANIRSALNETTKHRLTLNGLKVTNHIRTNNTNF